MLEAAADFNPLPGAQEGHSAPIFLAVERQSEEIGGPFSLGNLKALEDHRGRGQRAGSCRTLGKVGELHSAADLDIT